jgi:hypothetical protein
MSAQVRAELADLGVSVADYELLLIVSLEPNLQPSEVRW